MRSLPRSFIGLTISGIALFVLFVIVAYLSAPVPIISVSPVLLDRDGKILSVRLSSDDKWRLSLDDENMNPQFLKMLVTFEDKRFYSHFGVDPIALGRASWQWIKHGHVVSGGSTLTMQTVRLLNPRPRTLLSKLIECTQAIGLELRYSKKQILAMYLSRAPYGGNIEGLRTAAWVYFQQGPESLIPSQYALLAVIPQHPNLYNPLTRPKFAKAARDKLIDRLRVAQMLNHEEANEAKGDPLPERRYDFPTSAPHVMDRLMRLKPGQTVYKSTLDGVLQRQLEKITYQSIQNLESQQTAAALIVDNETAEIRGYVGSADPRSTCRQGYIDMVRAIRSPGSTLKPFIYALGFEDNLIHSETLMNDVSTDIQGYAPTNFHDIFHGDVTVREALQQSLNIPVIHLLDRLGPGRFVDWFESVGVHLRFPKIDQPIGLPVALGGVGISLWDLTSLYVTLSQKGQHKSLTLEKSASVESRRLLSPEAAYRVTKILEGAPLPDGFSDWVSTGRAAIAFKTGTSYGSRDALCVGYSGKHTVGVWVGRADGSSCPNQVGRKTAAPIVLKIFQSLLPNAPIATSIMDEMIPTALKRFKIYQHHSSMGTLKILSPRTQTTHLLSNHSDGTLRPIPLVLTGGTQPFQLWLNGKPLNIDLSQTRKGLWFPTGPGFYDLTVIDSSGAIDSVRIALQFP